MAAVDFEAVLLDLKGHIASKRSHGQDELLRVIAEFEVKRRVPEGQEGFDGTPARSHHRTEPAVGQPALAASHG